MVNGKNNFDGICSSGASIPVSEVQLECCSFENLYKAMNKCKSNVMWKDSVAGFVRNGLKNCRTLHEELMSGRYKLSSYSVFVINEKKKRIIVSTRMRDRVVQRSLCDNYLYGELTKSFIYDNCACLIGKGTDFARNRLKAHLQKHCRKHGTNGYVLKVDIHDYFGTTPHSVAKKAVEKRVKDDWAKQMVFTIIDSFDHISPDIGMGLGSQITQLVQLAVLDDLDHAIKEKLAIKHYVRYMDDFVLIHESKDCLQLCLDYIRYELKQLGLSLNEKKTGIQPLSHGIKFLGFSFRLQESGKVIMKLLPKSASKEKRKVKKLYNRYGEKKAIESYKCWRAFAVKGNNFRLLQGIDSDVRQIVRYRHDKESERIDVQAEN